MFISHLIQQKSAGYTSVSSFCMYILWVLCIWMASSVSRVTPMIRTSIWFPVNPNDMLCWGISLWQRSRRSGCCAANRRLPCWEETAAPVKQISLLWVRGHLPLSSPGRGVPLLKLGPFCNHSWFLLYLHSSPLSYPSLSTSLSFTPFSHTIRADTAHSVAFSPHRSLCSCNIRQVWQNCS